jgi:hypothetical protein
MIPVTDRGGLWGSETSKLPLFLHDRFPDGREVVGLTRRPRFYPLEAHATVRLE